MRKNISRILRRLDNWLRKNAISNREQELAELVDGCYVIVELFEPDSPSQLVWKQNWLKKAQKNVPECSSIWY